MVKGGTKEAGFSVGDDHGSVRITGWGFWPAEVARSFDTAVIGACRKSPRGTPIVIDASQLKPLREEGQWAFTTMFAMLRSLGMGHTSIITRSHLTKLQLLRIAKESGSSGIHFI
jgi:hypothetical protein